MISGTAHNARGLAQVQCSGFEDYSTLSSHAEMQRCIQELISSVQSSASYNAKKAEFGRH